MFNFTVNSLKALGLIKHVREITQQSTIHASVCSLVSAQCVHIHRDVNLHSHVVDRSSYLKCAQSAVMHSWESQVSGADAGWCYRSEFVLTDCKQMYWSL